MISKPYIPPISKFAIYGLHGDRDAVIPMDHRCKILISENGVGKTTILNALYAMLTCRFSRLNALEFEKITLTFPDDEITLHKRDIPKDSEIKDNLIISEIENKLPGTSEKLIQLSKILTTEKLKEHFLLRDAANKLKIPSSLLAERLKVIVRDFKEDDRLTNIKERISHNFNLEVLYLPTYRRIEEDLYNLGYIPIEIGLSDELLQSGMADVEDKINHISSGIRHTPAEWFNRFDKMIWEQLVNEAKIEGIEIGIENLESLQYVMDCIQNHVSQQGKENVLKLFDSSQIDKTEYKVLDDFLSDIIQLYDQQKEKNDTIDQFITFCNSYLIDKEVVYNQKQGTTEIVQNKSNCSLPFERLSSGEKQIVSVFSKLCLGTKQPHILIVDEPELSISIEWQRTLLPDILKSPNCRFLMAATHSPFIFDNNLNVYAVALNEYIREHEQC